MDSENSYFDPLRMRYLAHGLSGIKAVRTLRRWEDMDRGPEGTAQFSRSSRGAPWLLAAAIVNLGIGAALVALGSWPAAVAWIGGLLLWFPLLASLRQVLEHRSEDADPQVDYTTVDHGPVNRLFGDGPLASTLGSAGFNRHALHHWEPQVSYTNLKDIEAYLLRTEAAPVVRERKTTYRETFLRLLEL